MPTAPSLRTPARLPLVAPSILSADFGALADDCRHAVECGADALHLDVMDGHFVPNLTMGPALCAGLSRALPGVLLDVHLMISHPAMFVEPFAAAGAHHFTFHIEAVPSAQGVRDLVAVIHARGMTAGLAINPPTPFAAIEPVLSVPDMILVMSVNPGFSGQSFIESALETTRAVAGRLRPDQRLEMDGGISPANAARVREAGCDMLVAASAFFGRPRQERAGVIASLRG